MSWTEVSVQFVSVLSELITVVSMLILLSNWEGLNNSVMNLHYNYTHESVLRTDWYQQSAVKSEEGGSVVPK